MTCSLQRLFFGSCGQLYAKNNSVISNPEEEKNSNRNAPLQKVILAALIFNRAGPSVAGPIRIYQDVAGPTLTIV